MRLEKKKGFGAEIAYVGELVYGYRKFISSIMRRCNFEAVFGFMYGIDVEWMCEREKTVKRAVFAWNGVETEDRVILDKYQIDTIFVDINHYSSISNYNIFVLAGDSS